MSRPLRVLLSYTLCLCGLFFHVVFLGRTLLPSLWFPEGTTGSYGYQGRRPVNTFHVDLGAPLHELLPTNRIVGEMYRRGELPLWNPYHGCGIPLAAQYSTRAFFPYQVLENIAPYWTWDFFMLGRLLIAGFFTCLFLSLAGLSGPAAFAGGLVYMFSGTMVLFLNNEQFSNVAMILPVCMAAAEYCRSRPGRRSLALFGASLGLTLLAGQPEIALYALLLVCAYSAVFCGDLPAGLRGKAVFRLALAMPLGGGLAAVLLAPFFEYLGFAFHCHPAGGGMGVTDPASPNLLVCLFMPGLTEFPAFFDGFAHNGIWDFLGGFIGVSCAWLALCGLLHAAGARRKQLAFFFLFAGLILLKTFGVWPVSLLGRLPLFDQAWSPRWSGPVWSFCLAAAAGIGLQVLLEAGRIRRLFLWLAAAPALSICAGSLVAAAVKFGGAWATYLSVYSDGLRNVALPSYSLRELFFPLVLPGAVLLVGVILSLIRLFSGAFDRRRIACGIIGLVLVESWFYLPRGMELAWTGAKLAVVAAGLAAVHAFIGRRRPATVFFAACACLAALAIELFSPRGLPQRGDPFSRPPAAGLIGRQPGYFRLLAGDGVLTPNFSGAWELYDVRYVSALSVSLYQEYVDRYLMREPYHACTDRLCFNGLRDMFGRGQRSIYDDFAEKSLYYSFIGVKYIVTPQSRQLDLPLLGHNGESVYLNPACLDRAFVVSDIRTAGSAAEAQRSMGTAGLDLSRTAFVESAVPDAFLAAGSPAATPGSSGAADVRINEYRPRRVSVEAKLRQPGLLVLTDTYYPGWSVFVDGARSALVRVNGLVRGVLLPAGAHRVEFVYRPVSFAAGATISCICLAALCLLCFF